MKQSPMRLKLQHFAEDAPPPTEPPKVNYADLLKTDKEFQSFVDGERTRASQTATINTEKKVKALYDSQMSEKDKLSLMNADEKAAYWQKKAEDNENKAERYRQSESLKGEISKMFQDSKIPAELMSVFNFDTATAEEIKATATLLGGYEFFKKGDFDKAVMAAVADKLKQTPPENHGNPPITTKQQYTAMTIDERIKLKQEDPTLYHNLKENKFETTTI